MDPSSNWPGLSAYLEAGPDSSHLFLTHAQMHIHKDGSPGESLDGLLNSTGPSGPSGC